jgi:hypothetical protein
VTPVVRLLTLVGVIAVPAVGWFAQSWSGGTTLAVYWFETVAGCAFICARALLHRRWSPRRGHFRYEAPNPQRRSSARSSFVAGFAVVSFAFCGVHAVFLGTILLVLHLNGRGEIADIDWRTVGFGCLSVLLLLALDLAIDLPGLRRWSFRQVEQTADRGFIRVMVIHLTLMIGFVTVAMTDAPDALFGAFVVLKSLAALSVALPQWEPATPPAWLSRMLNRMPNVRPGERFEDEWEKDRGYEAARRDRNEQPWIVGERRLQRP